MNVCARMSVDSVLRFCLSNQIVQRILLYKHFTFGAYVIFKNTARIHSCITGK